MHRKRKSVGEPIGKLQIQNGSTDCFPKRSRKPHYKDLQCKYKHKKMQIFGAQLPITKINDRESPSNAPASM